MCENCKRLEKRVDELQQAFILMATKANAAEVNVDKYRQAIDNKILDTSINERTAAEQ